MQYIIYTLLIYLLFFTLIYSFFHNEEKKPKVSRKTNSGLLFGLVAALLLRLILAASIRGYGYDINCFSAWSQALGSNGMQNFYAPDYFADYPPLYMMVLYVIEKIRALFALPTTSPAYYLLLKTPAMLADLAIAWLLYKIGTKQLGTKTATAFSLLFLFCPAIIVNSAAWGQIDSFFTLAMLLSLWMVYEKKYELGAFLYTLCALIKPQAFIIAPVYLCVYLETKDWKMIGRCLAIGIGTLFVFALPFSHGVNVLWLFDKYKNTLQSYPHATVNAYNLYALFGYNWKDLSSIFLFLPVGVWSNIVIVLTVATSVWFYIKSKEPSKLFFMAYFIIATMFTLGGKMHERYLFPGLILLAVCYLYKKDRRLLLLFVAQGAMHYLNVGCVLADSLASTQPGNEYTATIFFASVGQIAVYLYAIYLMIRVYLFPERDVAKPPHEKDVIAKGKMVRLDYLLLTAITVFYSVVAFVNLGDTKAPQTFYVPQPNTPILLQLAHPGEVDHVMLYTGVGDPTAKYIVSTPDAGGAWSESASENHTVFIWKKLNINRVTDTIQITVDKPGCMIGEIAVIGGDQQPMQYTSAAAQLYDEQTVVPDMPTYKNGSYFDEIYHPRTAYEIIHKIEPYEITHPPLGKLIIGLGVRMFGMTPFGWRFMGTLAGIAMVPLFYLLCKKLFGRTSLCVMGTLLFTFDFMHFSQTRLATIDSFAVLLIMLMYYFIIDYVALDFNQEPLKKGFLPLALAGICFGLGAATKWICIYSAMGLAAILVVVWARSYVEQLSSRKKTDWNKRFGKTIAWCVLFFVVVPMCIYFASYLPEISYDSQGRGAIEYAASNQKYMLNYHQGVTQSHPYSSKWYEWLVDKRPLWAYLNNDLRGQGMASTISSFGNPLVWWAGLVSVCAALYFGIRKKSNAVLIILAGYLAQLLPWVAVTRVIFIYHYFACIPFMVLAIVYCIKVVQDRWNVPSWLIYSYCGATVVLFFVFYPVISGMPVPLNYISHLKWLQWWTFMN